MCRLWISSGQVSRVWGRSVQWWFSPAYVRIKKGHIYFERILCWILVILHITGNNENSYCDPVITTKYYSFQYAKRPCNFACLLWGQLTIEGKDNFSNVWKETNKIQTLKQLLLDNKNTSKEKFYDFKGHVLSSLS